MLRSLLSRLIRVFRPMDTLIPPPGVAGMSVLDLKAFEKTITVPAIILDKKKGHECTKTFKNQLINGCPLERIPSLQKIGGEDDDRRIILLGPGTVLTEAQKQWIHDNHGTLIDHKLLLEFDNYPTSVILRSILPPGLKDITKAFERVGHIAHLNLKDKMLDYKKIIGQVVMNKNRDIKTVVNKVDQIDNTFRFFKMELLCGEDNMVTTVKESQCAYTFDFSKVYWNSRLSFEHWNIVQLLKRGEVVVDMFAGVGPFAIPAAKKKCIVYANDLNPHSYSALVENAKTNKVKSEFFNAYCMDGREFTRKVANDLIARLSEDPSTRLIDHIIMNLPASATGFLDCLVGLYSDLPRPLIDTVTLPTVHCYAFSKAEDPKADCLAKVEDQMGPLPEGSYTLFHVRDVAINKVMVRVSFTIPDNILYHSKHGLTDCVSPTAKRACIED